MKNAKGSDVNESISVYRCHEISKQITDRMLFKCTTITRDDKPAKRKEKLN